MTSPHQIRNYSDGASATGRAPLPGLSPAQHDSDCSLHNAPALPVGPCDCSVEREIQAKGKTAARVTPADIEGNIKHQYFFTAADGVTLGNQPVASELSLLTFCVLVLRNGFTVTGESACVSPENFDAEIGRKIARENAVQKIWPLLGYELRTSLAWKDEPRTGSVSHGGSGSVGSGTPLAKDALVVPRVIAPTIGRKVWFWPNDVALLNGATFSNYSREQPMDATVVFVHSERRVNLTVLDHDGHPHAITSVPMRQPGDLVPKEMYCEWMPFQVGQAKAAAA